MGAETVPAMEMGSNAVHFATVKYHKVINDTTQKVREKKQTKNMNMMTNKMRSIFMRIVMKRMRKTDICFIDL